jgi:hypothetical protein
VGLLCCGLEGFAIAHECNADEQARTAHVADQRAAVRERFETRPKIGPVAFALATS